MYRVNFKNGFVFFITLEDAMFYVINKEDSLFVDDNFIKIRKVENF